MLRDQIYVSFDLLAGLPPSVANSVGEQVISGLILVIQKNHSIVRFPYFPLPRSRRTLTILYGVVPRQSGASSLHS